MIVFMKFKHFTFEDRKIIASCLAKEFRCVEIADTLGCDPTSVSKEIKRNRIDSTRFRYPVDEECQKLKRFPYVCANCNLKYTKCKFHQFKYDAKFAQVKADRLLVSSRIGVNYTKEEIEKLIIELNVGLSNKKSVYQIAAELPFDITPQTIYKYIRSGQIPVKRVDLPYAVTYKKRKKIKKEYEYNESKINRCNRTFVDYLAFSKASNLYTTELDFLGSKRGDPYTILTLIIREIHFTLIFLVENKNADKIVKIFDKIESKVGYENFVRVFGLILTDRDPSFADYEGFENSKIFDKKRANVFYCDAYRSTQKASVENMNKQLRMFFPKGKYLSNFSKDDVKRINIFLNKRKLKSLDGFSPEEVFIRIFGEKVFNNLFN